ncbi:MAG: c-type cytochrome [Thiolinea sp.]
MPRCCNKGETMYRQGLLPNGQHLQAKVAGDVTVNGRMFSCASCHQRSGLGSVEGSVITWPINGKQLFTPRRRTGAWNADKQHQGPGTQRWTLPEQYQAADVRPAYDDETLTRLIRTGVDASGNRIKQVMPRYDMSDADMAVLINYLKNLSGKFDPGVDDKVIRFATVVTEGVDEAERQAMLSVLQNHITVHNTQTRPHLRRAEKGPFYKDRNVWVLSPTGA